MSQNVHVKGRKRSIVVTSFTGVANDGIADATDADAGAGTVLSSESSDETVAMNGKLCRDKDRNRRQGNQGKQDRPWKTQAENTLVF